MSDRSVDIRATVKLPEPGPVVDADSPEGKKMVAETSKPASVSTMSLEERAARKKLLITAFDRGVVSDRLAVPLPPHLHGEWIRYDPFQIKHMEDLGFRFDPQYGGDRALHSDGTGKPKVGDVVFMVCEREVKELIDEVKAERFKDRHAKPGKQVAIEEREAASATARETGNEIPTFAESQHREARKGDISAALDAIREQTATTQ